MKCSRCNIALTQDNHNKGRTVCKFCYNNHVLAYYKNKFCSNSSSKSDASTQTDFLSGKQDSSYEQDSSNKQDRSSKHEKSNKQGRSSKHDSPNKQDSSSKQDISTNYLIAVDPIILCEKLQETLEKSVKSVSVIVLIKMIIDELLRVKAITRRQYNNMCKNFDFI